MANSNWEEMISLNSRSELTDMALGPPADYLHQDRGEVEWDQARISRPEALAADTSPLPSTEQREGYYGSNHYNFWASGLRDYCQLLEWLEPNQIARGTLLDFGCATGRFLRHAQAQTKIGFAEVVGCDINRSHVDWIAKYLPADIKIFQNTSIPTLPLPDASVDVVTAFSVFTHIECFDTTWLMELRRILKPGGIVWLTIHGPRTWREIKPSWPLYPALTSHPDYPAHRQSKELPRERLVYRWRADGSYSANIFYDEAYIRRTWGRILTVRDLFPALPYFQDVLVLQKT